MSTNPIVDLETAPDSEAKTQQQIEKIIAYEPKGAERLYASYKRPQAAETEQETVEAAVKALRELEAIPAIVAIYEETHDPRLLAKLEEFAQVWAQEYKPFPDGRINAIDQRYLYPFLYSYAYIATELSPTTQEHIQELAKVIIDNEMANWYTRKLQNHGENTQHNNHASYSNMIGMACVAIFKKTGFKDSERYQRLFLDGSEKLNMEGFFNHVVNNVKEDGRSYDFIQRDSAHYHIFNQIAWERTYKICKDLGIEVPGEVEANLFAARKFALELANGTRPHMEFVKGDTKFKKDRTRWPDKSDKPFDINSKIVKEFMAELA